MSWYIPYFEGNRLTVYSLRGDQPGSIELPVVKRELGVNNEHDCDTLSMVTHQGALVDVSSLMTRMEKSDKTRAAIEHRYKQIKVELGQCFFLLLWTEVGLVARESVYVFSFLVSEEIKASHAVSEQNAQKMSVDLQDQKRRIREQRKTITNTEAINKSYKDMLSKVTCSLKDLTENVQNTMNTASCSDTEPLNGN